MAVQLPADLVEGLFQRRLNDLMIGHEGLCPRPMFVIADDQSRLRCRCGRGWDLKHLELPN